MRWSLVLRRQSTVRIADQVTYCFASRVANIRTNIMCSHRLIGSRSVRLIDKRRQVFDPSRAYSSELSTLPSDLVISRLHTEFGRDLFNRSFVDSVVMTLGWTSFYMYPAAMWRFEPILLRRIFVTSNSPRWRLR